MFSETKVSAKSAISVLILSLVFLTNRAFTQVIPTNEWVNFFGLNSLFQGVPLPVGTVVDAYDPQDAQCGTFTVTNEGQYGFMSVYRDDILTPSIDEGAEPGDAIRFVINGIDANTLGPDAVNWTENGAVLHVELEVQNNIPLEIKSFLEGPYDSANHEMTTNLSTGGPIPTISPYSENPRTVSSIPANINDWVL
ncbi:MAG: hypothetical protein ACE5HX_18760, partial [bacterium]